MEAMARASYEAELRAATLDPKRQVLAAHALAPRRTVTLLADTVLATQRRAVEASWGSLLRRGAESDLWRVLEAAHLLRLCRPGHQRWIRARRQDLARTEEASAARHHRARRSRRT